jgi:diaminopimelate decarboxylase
MNHDALLQAATEHGTPLYVYNTQDLRQRAQLLTSLTFPFGSTIRYAAKANSVPEILAIFHEEGLHFDASSSYEAEELIARGIPPAHISLSSQQPAHNLEALLKQGVRFVVTSLHQLELFLKTPGHPGTVALRVNAGLGSGGTNRTTTGGTASSFGLWHEYVPEALAMGYKAGVMIDRLHMHIGSGADPAIWGKAMDVALDVVRKMPQVETIDIGGGYKVHRYGSEQETDMHAVAAVFAEQLSQFASETGRKLHLEIEPGTWLVAHSGTLVAQVVDMVDTGKAGFNFLRLNTGMNDILRPSLYGAQHGIEVLSEHEEKELYVVVGHNCESGDILTPGKGNPEIIEPRLLNKTAIGDLVAIRDVGAYCQSMSAKGYNAFPVTKHTMM